MRITYQEAAHLLKSGAVVAIPTETVYGLAAHLHSKQAIETIFQLKKRPRENPLIIHVRDIDQVHSFIKEKPPHLDELLQHFWPGPLTVIVEVDPSLVPVEARAKLTTAAFRMADHPLLEKLLHIVSPLVAPSANLSGKPSATRAKHIESDFGDDFPVLDGGPCQHGLESTILAYKDGFWCIAREGSIPKEKFTPILRYTPEKIAAGKKPISPGQMFRHYSPEATLYLTKPTHYVDTMIGFSDRSYTGFKHIYRLGPSTDPKEVSHHLYDILRQLDSDGVREAIVDIDIPTTGIWSTILERIKKAASK